MRFVRWVVDVAVVSTMVLSSLAPAAQAVEVGLHARLRGSNAFAKTSGFSEYERDSRGREVEVTVRNIALLAGKRVTVYVAGRKVGTILVRSTGVAHREWDTEHGDRIPLASAGDRVKVRTTGGKLVASGKYVREAHD